MPRLKSAKKRLRQSLKRQVLNSKRKEAYRKVKRQLKKAFHGKENAEKITELVSQFYQAVDKAAKTGVIHQNKAAREKARIVALAKKSGTSITEERGKRKKVKSAKKTGKAKTPKVKKKIGSSRRGK